MRRMGGKIAPEPPPTSLRRGSLQRAQARGVDGGARRRHVRRSMSTRLDLSGLKCPLPVLRTRKALRELASGDVIEVVCTDPMSAIDIPNMVREQGDALLEHRADAPSLYFRIKKA